MRVLIKTISIIGFFILLIYGIQLAMFYFNQEQSLFLKPSLSEEDAKKISTNRENVEELIIEVEENIHIHGWIMENQTDRTSPAPLLIYFGGNGEELSHSIDSFNHLDGWSVLLMNYRGYGLSDGSPSEETLFHDARAMYDELTERDRIVVAMGRSMGTAPATHLSKERDLAGTILVSPYDSRTRLSEHRHPFIPAQQLIRHPFELSDKAHSIESPLLAFVASEDRVIPPEHSQVTIDAWAGEKKEVYLEGFGHNDLQASENYWENIEKFLENKKGQKP
ncbi:alpha/beta hydrolase [Salipaludibacillus daqingensis]|uniref:alpha/beta hydrolase n=1 Tax=Salipaludibacillus daqingensis TaxID=3041001 RepID=UPI002475EAAA|nr:alpha/beta fold hydrolase [Salipaludibacillus daqingensis]